jgi:hypothetical protein
MPELETGQHQSLGSRSLRWAETRRMRHINEHGPEANEAVDENVRIKRWLAFHWVIDGLSGDHQLNLAWIRSR